MLRFVYRNFYLCPATRFKKNMEVFTSVAALRAQLEQVDPSGLGFVPTMGALHAGHRSLVERARKENAVVAVSVFVNPTQFNDKNDLRHYPRTPEADARLLEEAGADYVLMPSVEEIYPEPDTRQFDFGAVDKVMEGATRPGHFNGVAQVVSRLFDIVRPARAYFGEKDFQQIAVIRAMAEQLGLPVQIVECPIVRGDDGLALSSRNQLLDEAHRAAAPHIYATLRAAVEKSHELTPARLKAWVAEEIDRNPLLKTIYYQSVDARTMQEVSAWDDASRIQGCIAVQAGPIRLIDNIRIR
jgi:pantoate--beta-alanine ligase